MTPADKQVGKQADKLKKQPQQCSLQLHQFHQIDMRDWLFWLDAARELAVAAGREHRRLHTIATEALTWHALHDRMLAAGLHELRDEPLFRAAKMLYLQTESETRCGR